MSPAEADPHTLRVKRQAYQLNIDGDVTVTVDQNGGSNIESGKNSVIEKNECLRQLGSMASLRRVLTFLWRRRLQRKARLQVGFDFKHLQIQSFSGECSGPSARYHSCNLEDCPEDATDFRAQQCASHNDDPVNGKYYKVSIWQCLRNSFSGYHTRVQTSAS